MLRSLSQNRMIRDLLVSVALTVIAALAGAALAHASSEVRSCRTLLSLAPRNPSPELTRVFELGKIQSQMYVRYLLGRGPQDRMAVVELRQIKALNEIYLGFPLTEKLLQTLALELQQATFQLDSGTTNLMAMNYKKFFLPTATAESQLRLRLLEPTITKVAQQIQNDPRFPKDFPLQQFLKENLRLSLGRDPVEASMLLVLALSPRTQGIQDYSTFIREIRQTRYRLLQAVQNSALTWGDFLKVLREVQTGKLNTDGLSHLLGTSGLRKSYEDILLYLDLLKAVDYLPHSSATEFPAGPRLAMEMRRGVPFGKFKTNWIVEKQIFLENGTGASAVFSTDIQGLGLIGLRLADMWVADGAHRSQISTVYSQSSKSLEGYILELRQRLETELSRLGPQPEILVHMSGDDAAWAIKGLTPRQIQSLPEVLQNLQSSASAFQIAGIPLRAYVSRPINLIENSKSALEAALEESRSSLKPAR